jgi:myo-inositol catabolism protein IolS
MHYRRLGKSDLEVSVVAMGCWPIVGDRFWPNQSLEDSIATIEQALDLGVNFFDTAESYGNGYSEEILSHVLPARRDKVVIASKAAPENLEPSKLAVSLDASLKRLKSDHLDLYQIHWPNRDIPIGDTMAAMEKFRQQGKIRYIGVSNFGPGDLGDLLAHGRCESNQLPYSLLWRAVEFEIQPLCERNSVSILPYCPLMQGLLTGKFTSADDVPPERARTRHYGPTRPQIRHQEPGCEKETFEAIDAIREISEKIHQPMSAVSLAWLLHQPSVPSVVVGTRTPAQIRENVQAAGLSLTPDILAQLDKATRIVKTYLGPNPDLWQSGDNSRYR